MAEKEDKVRKIYSRFKKAMDSQKRKDFEISVEAARRVFKGQVFDDAVENEMKQRGIPPVKVARGTTNALRFASILTANRPEIKALPKGRGDGAVATLMQRAFTKIWEENNGNQKNFRTVLGTIRDGLCHYNAWTEKYGLGEVKIKFNKLDAKYVYYDPDTGEDGLEDWGYRIVARAISPQEAKDLYKLKDSELYYAGIESPTEMTETQTRDSQPGGSYDDVPGGQQNIKKNIWEIEYYEQIKKKKTHIRDVAFNKPIDVDIAENIEQAKMATVLASPSPMPPEERFEEFEVTEKDMNYCLVVGNKILEDTDNPYGRDQLGEPIDPILPLVNIPIGELYPRGNVFFSIGPLEEICKRRGQSIALVAATMGSPILYKEGTINIQVWNNEIAKPKGLLPHHADPDERPTPLYQPGPDLSRVFALEDRALQDLNDVFNLTPVLMGQQETGRMSGRLAAMLKEFGMEGNSYFLSTVEELFRKLGIALIVMALNEWPFHYWERLIEDEDKDPQTQMPTEPYMAALKKIESKDINIIDYDIGIRSGSSLPTNRMARLDMAIELATTPIHPDAVYDAEAVLNLLDDPQAQSVTERKNKMKDMGMALGKMQEEMQQLSMQAQQLAKQLELEKKTNEELRLKQVEEVGSMKMRYEIALTKAKEEANNYREISAIMNRSKDIQRNQEVQNVRRSQQRGKQ